ncbi:MAG: dTDP-glucose 4,6-dehydratase, partial [Alphaproteobacteria bacterium]|nr:dTDP-glucose 4,6-dehydratase [Alphaproteobacteria bacterium]
VTGGCGFIGTHLLELLLKETDYKILVADKLSYAADARNISKFIQQNSYNEDRIKFFYVDIANAATLGSIFCDNKIDGVINVAAESHVDNSITGPEPFVYSNIVGPLNLLELSKKHNVKKFLQVSTDEVYGSASNMDMFTESDILNPSSIYSASKASADLLALSYYKTHGMHVNITRCSNNYGPYQHHEKLLPKVILNALSDKKIPVYGNGTNTREWIYAKDHCRAILNVFQEGLPGEIYNVSTIVEYTNIAIIKLILKMLGKSENLITFVEDRKGHDQAYRICSKKISRELNWSVDENLFEANMLHTIQWYTDRHNENFFNKSS